MAESQVQSTTTHVEIMNEQKDYSNERKHKKHNPKATKYLQKDENFNDTEFIKNTREENNEDVTTSTPTHISREFQNLLQTIVKDLTSQVVVNQPRNIYDFLANYLEQQVRERNSSIETTLGGETSNLSILDNMTKRENDNTTRIHKITVASLTSDENYKEHTEETDQGSKIHHGQIKLDHSAVASGISGGHQEYDRQKSSFLVSSKNTTSFTSFQKPHDPELCHLEGHTGEIKQIQIIDLFAITCSVDGNIGIWNLDSCQLVMEYTCTKCPTDFVVISRSRYKHILILSMDDGRIVVFKVQLGNQCHIRLNAWAPLHFPNPIKAIAASANEQFLATGCCFDMPQLSVNGLIGRTSRGTLKLWDLSSILDHVNNDADEYLECEYLALKTYRQIISGSKVCPRFSSYDKLSLQNGSDKDKNYGIGAIQFTPDSKKIVVGFCQPVANDPPWEDPKMIAVLDTKTLDTLWLQLSSHFEVNGIGFANVPDEDGSVCAPWTMFVATSRKLHKVAFMCKDDPGDRSRVRLHYPWQLDMDEQHYGGDFSPDGNLICSASGSTIHVYESGSAVCVASYHGHENQVTLVKFCDYGRSIVSADVSGLVKFWRAPSRIRALPKITVSSELPQLA